MSSPSSRAALIAALLLAACKGSPQATDRALAPPGSADAIAARDRGNDQVLTEDGSVDAPMADTAPVQVDAPVLPDGARDLLADAMACGRAGQPCCDYGVCAGAQDCCVEGHCVPAGQRCPQALGICAGGSCGSCGGIGQLCCTEAGYPRCTQPYGDCTGVLLGGIVQDVCRACGRLGEPCCGGQDLTCSAPDLACGFTNPRQCVKCGEPGNPCCPGDRCNGDACCVGGRCSAPGLSCGGGPANQCQQGRCTACGGVNQPCCGDHTCQEANTLCIFGNVNPLDPGVCKPCGQPGQVACKGGGCLDPGTIATSQADQELCLPCGQLNQQCCVHSACASGLGCSFDGCVPCGGKGQPCCANGACTGSLDCMSGTCQSCGGPGETCCDFKTCRDGGCCMLGQCSGNGTLCRYSNAVPIWGTCRNGTCDGCGGIGQPCCWGASSSDDPTCTAGAACEGRKTCVACGKPGQPCCEGHCDQGCCAGFDPKVPARPLCVAVGQACNLFTGAGACRADGACTSCGGLDAPCCIFELAPNCLAANTRCSLAVTSPKCEPCGRIAQHCCTGEPACEPGARCDGSWCGAL